MATIDIRLAQLDDTETISALFRSRINVWQRLNAQGRAEDVPYAALTIYERYLHGGAWMSIETAALHLGHLLHGAGLPLLVCVDGEIRAYAEAYHSSEPAPYGSHLHLGELVIDAEQNGAGLVGALVKRLRTEAKSRECQRVTVSAVGSDTEAAAFYAHYGFAPLGQVARYMLSARTGQGLYRTVEHPAADAAQITGWAMPAGRYASARQHWEQLWSPTFDILPELRRQRTDRLHFSASGHEAFIHIRQQMYNARAADVSCWSPRTLSSQLLVALRDWAHREGYRTLMLTVAPEIVKTLTPEAEADGYTHAVYALEV